MESWIENVLLYDDFGDDREPGSVVGACSTSGFARSGLDLERVISIDNGALRIAPLIEAGFGRAGIAYGPFSGKPGLAYLVNILNGHNTAQAESLPDTFAERMMSWLSGDQLDPKWLRGIKWLKSGRVRRTLRQFSWWKRAAKNSHPVPVLDENLAVGWFPVALVADPRSEGSAFVMHALGPENGELWAGRAGCRTKAVRGVQNLPLYLAAVIRADGVVYYVASLRGAPGMAGHPKFSPVAVEKGPLADEVYLGIHQGVLGQIGWRLDTRVKGVRVSQVEGYDLWCGGAHAADKLTGNGNLDKSEAEIGGGWRVLQGAAHRSVKGAIGCGKETIAIVVPASPTGLIHAEASPGSGDTTRIGLIWRFLDDRNHWRMELGEQACEIVLISNGERRILASKEYADSLGGQTHRLQVLDTGKHTMAYVDGEPVVQTWIRDTTLEDATGVGILFGEKGEAGLGAISRFEAHPRHISLPGSVSTDSPWFRTGNRIVIKDDFGGDAGDIEGRLTPVGGRRWRRVIGKGTIETTGNGAARIRGSVQEPCPGRTAYCLDWENDEFADLEVTVTPPGTQRGERERSTAGFILYQDPDNYVTLNVWRADYYAGASISTFFKFDGFEDTYDAIWTNVGDRVFYGRPSRLKLCCDGQQYLVFVNEEPVLYRAFRDVYPDFARLRIRKVGLLANWEFGTDTGSEFRHFQARS